MQQTYQVLPLCETAIVPRPPVTTHSLLEDSDIRLIVDIKQDLWVSTPSKVLEIIVGNICRNAHKYTDCGEIKVTVTEDRILIADTGKGIPEDLLPDIFERHVRGRGHQQAGEGIGLAIVKRLCDQFGWQISIENRSSGGVLVTLLTPGND